MSEEYTAFEDIVFDGITLKNTIEQFDPEIIGMILEECGSVDAYIASLANTETAGILWESLQCCTVREQKIMILRFGLLNGTPRSLDEVAERMGTTRERIRQIESRALRRAGSHIRSRKNLMDFLKES